MSQLKRYYEEISKKKMKDHALRVEGEFYAMAAAQGGLDNSKFQDYLDAYKGKEKKPAKEIIKDIKDFGLPIEEN